MLRAFAEQNDLVRRLVGYDSSDCSTTDIAFIVHQVLEKGADRHGAGAVIQADVNLFFDRVPVFPFFKAFKNDRFHIH